MALKFGKKGGDTTKDKTEEKQNNTASTGKKSFLKKGKEAQTAMVQEEQKAEARAANANKAFRFRIKYEGKKTPEVTITFLDGELNEEGMLDIPYAREHTVKINGRFENIICTEDEEGYCPVCATGDEPALVGYLTVVDHTPYTLKNGTVREMTRKLFVAKKATIQMLTNQAQKRGGLTGCTYGVMRTGEREPAVGNQYDFVQKDTLDDLIKMAEDENAEEIFTPLDYEEELEYRTAEELVELGIGVAQSGPGTEKSMKDYSNSM